MSYPPKLPLWSLCALLLGLLAACSAQTPEEHLASARAYVASGESDAAILELKNALKKDATLVAARAELGRLQFSAGEYAEADAEFERALAGVLPADQSESLADLALLTKIRLRQAADVISELGTQESLTPARQALLGLARLALDDTELAGEDFVAALAAADDLALAHYGQARIAWGAGDTDAARKSFNRAAELSPLDPVLVLTKAEFELDQRQLDAARATFEQALALPGRDLAARLGLTRVLVFEQNYGEADKALAEVLRAAPDLVPALYLRALIAYEQDDLGAAELTLREVLSAQSDYSPALYLIGAVQFRQQDFLQAESNLSTYVADNPGNASARKLLGAVRMQNSNYAGVVEALASTAANSTDAQSLAMLGTAYARLNRLNEASDLLDRAVELAPDVGELRNQLAVTLLAAGESEQAIGQLRSAIELDGELQLSDYLLVLAQLRQGKVADALAAAQALRERAPDDPMGDNLLGAVYFADGNTQAARDSFTVALGKQPSFQPAALNLVRLELAEGNRDAAVAGLEALLEADADNERALLQLAELQLEPLSAASSPESGTEQRTAALASAQQLLQRAERAHSQSLAPKLALARLGLIGGDAELAMVQSERALDIASNNPDVLFVRVEALLAAGEREATEVPLKTLSTLVRAAKPTNSAQRLRLAQLYERAGQSQQARTIYADLNADGSAVREAANLALLRFDLSDGQPRRARQRLERVGEAERSGTLYRLLRADVLRAEGNNAEAAAGYNALLAEGNRDALFRLVALHTGEGKQGRVRKLLEEWRATHPDDAGVEIALATTALTGGDFEAARTLFETVLEDSPDNVVVLNNLAWLYQQTGDSRAREMGRKAWELAPESADVGDTYGWILFKSGDVQRGRDVLVAAHRLAPRNPSIAFHAASALAETGRSGQALAALRSVGEQRLANSTDAQAAAVLLRELVAIDEVEVDTKREDPLIER